MEPLHEQRGEDRERPRLAHRPCSGHHGGNRAEPRARSEALGARRAPVLAPVDDDSPGEDRPHRNAAPPLGLDQGRRERRQRRRPRRCGHRPIAPEPDPVEDALAQTAEPAVQRREVDRREPRRRLAQPIGRLEVPRRGRPHDRHSIRLPWPEVGGKNPEAASARRAARERDLGHGLPPGTVLLPEEDRPSLDPAPREAHAHHAAARAGRQPQPVRHPAAALTKVGEERIMK